MNARDVAASIIDLDNIAADIDENYDSHVAAMVRQAAETLRDIADEFYQLEGSFLIHLDMIRQHKLERETHRKDYR